MCYWVARGKKHSLGTLGFDWNTVYLPEAIQKCAVLFFFFQNCRHVQCSISRVILLPPHTPQVAVLNAWELPCSKGYRVIVCKVIVLVVDFYLLEYYFIIRRYSCYMVEYAFFWLFWFSVNIRNIACCCFQTSDSPPIPQTW